MTFVCFGSCPLEVFDSKSRPMAIFQICQRVMDFLRLEDNVCPKSASMCANAWHQNDISKPQSQRVSFFERPVIELNHFCLPQGSFEWVDLLEITWMKLYFWLLPYVVLNTLVPECSRPIMEIWWIMMMKYDELWWNMMKYDEIWWNMTLYWTESVSTLALGFFNSVRSEK